MNGFDRTILLWVNQFAGRSEFFDVCVRALDLNLLKGGVFATALLWAWNAAGSERQRRRQIIVATVVAALCAIAAGRGLAALLPFRPRPAFRSDLVFVPPIGTVSDMLRTWSSFPSDHAMFFGALATGLGFISVRAGVLAHVYALLVILAPRIYLGKHHPTDILAGYALGVLFAVVANRPQHQLRLSSAPLRWAQQRPAVFHAMAFLLMFQFATMFDDAKEIMSAGARVGHVVATRVGIGGTRVPSTFTLAVQPGAPTSRTASALQLK